MLISLHDGEGGAEAPSETRAQTVGVCEAHRRPLGHGEPMGDRGHQDSRADGALPPVSHGEGDENPIAAWLSFLAELIAEEVVKEMGTNTK